MNRRKEEKQTGLDVKDFKEEFKNMSDDEVKKLMDSKKEKK